MQTRRRAFYDRRTRFVVELTIVNFLIDLDLVLYEGGKHTVPP